MNILLLKWVLTDMMTCKPQHTACGFATRCKRKCNQTRKKCCNLIGQQISDRLATVEPQLDPPLAVQLPSQNHRLASIQGRFRSGLESRLTIDKLDSQTPGPEPRWNDQGQLAVLSRTKESSTARTYYQNIQDWGWAGAFLEIEAGGCSKVQKKMEPRA